LELADVGDEKGAADVDLSFGGSGIVGGTAAAGVGEVDVREFVELEATDVKTAKIGTGLADEWLSDEVFLVTWGFSDDE